MLCGENLGMGRTQRGTKSPDRYPSTMVEGISLRPPIREGAAKRLEPEHPRAAPGWPGRVVPPSGIRNGGNTSPDPASDSQLHGGMQSGLPKGIEVHHHVSIPVCGSGFPKGSLLVFTGPRTPTLILLWRCHRGSNPFPHGPPREYPLRPKPPHLSSSYSPRRPLPGHADFSGPILRAKLPRHLPEHPRLLRR